MAINADDMRVRAAAIELNVSARGLGRSSETIDRLEADARSGAQGPRANALWDIALLGHRGIQPGAPSKPSAAPSTIRTSATGPSRALRLSAATT